MGKGTGANKLGANIMKRFMRLLIAGVVGVVGFGLGPFSLYAQSTSLLTPNNTTTVDFGSALVTKPMKIGTSNPVTCSQGEQFFNTTQPAGKNIFLCTATNTWTLSAGLGAYSQAFTSQTSVALNHNLGTTDITVQCFDAGSPPAYIGWNTLQLTNSTTATVTFSGSQSGKCVVVHGGNGAGGSQGATAYTDLVDSKLTKDSTTQVTISAGKIQFNSVSVGAPSSAETITNPTDTTGTVWIGVDVSSGTATLKAWHDLTALTCSGGITCASGATGFPAEDVIPYGTVTVATNAFDVVADVRAPLSIDTYVAGAGICRTGNTFSVCLTTKTIEIVVFDFATDTATGDGKYFFYVPSTMNNGVITGVHAQVITAGTTNTTDVQIARCEPVATGNACSGTVVDVLTTKLTVDSGEDDSSTAATAAVINTSNDDLTTGRVLRVDVDAVSTTAAKGLILTILVQVPGA
jgi:hypothetical protein